MKILEKLFRSKISYEDTAADGLSQPEREAILDLMLLGIYADNHLSLAEDALIQAQAERLDWESGTSIDVYMALATDRARTASQSDEQEDQFLRFIGQRLNSDTAKNQALGLARDLFLSDGETAAETAFVERLQQYI